MLVCMVLVILVMSVILEFISDAHTGTFEASSDSLFGAAMLCEIAAADFLLGLRLFDECWRLTCCWALLIFSQRNDCHSNERINSWKTIEATFEYLVMETCETS